MKKRPQILAGMAGGAVWGCVLLWIGSRPHPDMIVEWAVAAGLFMAALPMAAMIGRLAQRRFFDDAIIDGEPLSGPAAIDQRVLTNTSEQLLLAAATWPLAAWQIGPAMPLVLGLSFAVTRILFWIGYHVAPPLRGFGFAAGFYPTVLAVLATIVTFLF